MNLKILKVCKLKWVEIQKIETKIEKIACSSTNNLILYNTTNGITTLKKHVFPYHFNIAKMFEEDINNVVKGELEKQLVKKKPYLFGNVIPKFFLAQDPFKKEDV